VWRDRMNTVDEKIVWVGSRDSFDSPPKRFLVTIPIALRRVMIETVKSVDDADPFARVIANLVAAGVQNVEDIANLIGITDVAFVNEVARRLAQRKILRMVNGKLEPIDHSGHGDREGRTREVHYVVQDLLSGRVWPRLAKRVIYVEYGDDDRSVLFGNPGKPIVRRCWNVSSRNEVVEPTEDEVRYVVSSHLRDVRLIGIKPNTDRARHLAIFGRPEAKTPFSSRLVPGYDVYRLLLGFQSKGQTAEVEDPFEVGPWYELSSWSRRLLEANPHLDTRVSDWHQRQHERSESTFGQISEPIGSTAKPMEESDETKTAHLGRQEFLDVSEMMLRLAAYLRADLSAMNSKRLGLTYDANRDCLRVCQRWLEIGFTKPEVKPTLVPALVERAAEGDPTRLVDLFFAWTLLVDDCRGQELAKVAPNLPHDLLGVGTSRTLTVNPALRDITALGYPQSTRS